MQLCMSAAFYLRGALAGVYSRVCRSFCTEDLRVCTVVCVGLSVRIVCIALAGVYNWLLCTVYLQDEDIRL